MADTKPQSAVDDLGITPSPWVADGYYIRCANDRTRWVVELVSARERDNDRALANARLIAAAPELYTALQSMLDYATEASRYIEGIHNREEWYAARDFARAALEKAQKGGA